GGGGPLRGQRGVRRPAGRPCEGPRNRSEEAQRERRRGGARASDRRERSARPDDADLRTPGPAAHEGDRRALSRGRQRRRDGDPGPLRRGTHACQATQPMSPETVGVVGSGTMGSGIAHTAALYGRPVILCDVAPEPLDRAVASIGKGLARSVEKGKLAAEARDAVLGRIETTTDLGALARADFV